MKTNSFIILLLLALVLTSCSKTPNCGEPDVDPKIIQKDFNGWWAYHCNNITLSTAFCALDASSNSIDKESFLEILTSGDYIPLRLNSKDSLTYYKLYKLDTTADIGIKTTIEEAAKIGYAHYKMEGKELPEFNFTDLDGKVFNRETTKDKTIVLKCWYIHCQKCVEEMPALNELMKQYRDRKDISFLSLANDSNEDLKKFLKKKSFYFSVVPSQETYMNDVLKISQYPTYLILNKKGLISKVVSNYKELELALKEETL